VERLFNAAGQIVQTARQCKLSDEHFDMFVFCMIVLRKCEFL